MAIARKKKDKAEIVVPEKLYFRIGEVSRLSELPTHVLRFWESEFAQLKPTKSSSGQRMYRRREVEFILTLKRLLHQEGYTISGAREKLKAEMRPGKSQSALPFPARPRTERLRAVRHELSEILSILAPKHRK